MKEHLLTILLSLFIFVTTEVHAQMSVTELTTAQRNSLQEFLSANSQLRFIPETWFDEENLRYARYRWGLGRDFRPYYQSVDFNGDGKMDFALILLNSRMRQLSIVVFNQIPGNTYRVAHIENVGEFHSSLFITHNRGRLMYGVLETSICGIFIPAGRGYIVEPCT